MFIENSSAHSGAINDFFLDEMGGELGLVEMARLAPVLLGEVSHVEVEVPDGHLPALEHQQM